MGMIRKGGVSKLCGQELNHVGPCGKLKTLGLFPESICSHRWGSGVTRLAF